MESFRISDSNQIKKGPEILHKVVSEKPVNENLRDGKAVAETLFKMKANNSEKNSDTHFDKKQIEQAAEKINKSLKGATTKIKIDFDKSSGKMVIHLINGENNEIIRQIPPDSLLKLSAKISDYLGDWPEKDSHSDGAVVDTKI